MSEYAKVMLLLAIVATLCLYFGTHRAKARRNRYRETSILESYFFSRQQGHIAELFRRRVGIDEGVADKIRSCGEYHDIQ